MNFFIEGLNELDSDKYYRTYYNSSLYNWTIIKCKNKKVISFLWLGGRFIFWKR